MSSPVVFNLVSFVCNTDSGDDDSDSTSPAFIELEESFKLSAGLKPDINRAIVPYAQFQNLGDGSNWTGGQIQMFYGSHDTPAVSIEGISIVDCEPLKMVQMVGSSDGGSGSTNANWVPESYRLFFADWRQRWIEPRGGRLKIGFINDGDTPPSMGGSGGATNSQSTREMTLTQMIQACLTAMGSAAAPPNVDGIAAPRRVQWFGSHAPTELAKLLALAGLQFVPALAGSDGTIVTIASQPLPSFPGEDDVLPVVSVPKSDARGTTVVVTSYPTRSVSTQTLVGPQPPGSGSFYFVARETDGSWQPIDSVSYYAGSAAAAWKAKFATVTPTKYANQAEADAYSYIRLDDSPGGGLPPASMSPILTRRFESAISDFAISVQAPCAQRDSTGVWSNPASGSYVQIAACTLMDKLVIQLSQAIFQVTKNTTDIYTNFQEITDGLSVRFSTEDATQDDLQNWIPKYFEAGFQIAGDGSVTAMDAEATSAALLSSDEHTVVICRPELLLLTVDGAAINQADLSSRAQSIAQQYLANATAPTQICQARGFQSIAPSASVSRVEWDQRELLTRAIVNDWFAPTGSTLSPAALASIEHGEAHPSQHTTQSRRTELGASGSTAQAMPIQPTQQTQVPINGPIWCRASANPSVGNAGVNKPPAAATLVYTLFSLDGNTIATNVSVKFARQLGHVTPATWVLAQQYTDGTWWILVHDEVLDAGACA